MTPFEPAEAAEPPLLLPAEPTVEPAVPAGENRQAGSEACMSPETLSELNMVLLLLLLAELVLVWVVVLGLEAEEPPPALPAKYCANSWPPLLRLS